MLPLQNITRACDDCPGVSEVHQQQLCDPGSKYVQQVTGAARPVLRSTAQEEFKESRRQNWRTR